MNKHFFITLLGTAVLASCNSTNNESATALKESAEKISKPCKRDYYRASFDRIHRETSYQHS